MLSCTGFVPVCAFLNLLFYFGCQLPPVIIWTFKRCRLNTPTWACPFPEVWAGPACQLEDIKFWHILAMLACCLIFTAALCCCFRVHLTHRPSCGKPNCFRSVNHISTTPIADNSRELRLRKVKRVKHTHTRSQRTCLMMSLRSLMTMQRRGQFSTLTIAFVPTLSKSNIL